MAQTNAVIRLVDGRLAWYPPGAGAAPRWLDQDGPREELRAALSQRRLNLCFAAPGADVRLLSMPVSATERRHIARSLPFTLEDDVGQAIEDLHFASCPAGPGLLAVAVCARRCMDSWRELLADFAGVARWLPEPLLLPWRQGEWCLLLEGDRALVRTSACTGFAAERDLLEPLLAAQLRAAQPPRAVIVYGSDQQADTQLLPEAVRELVQWRRGDLHTAMLVSEGGVNLNLLQGDYAQRLPLGRWWREWRAVAAVFAGAFALQLAASYADYRALSAENLALRTAVQDSYRRAFPQGQVVDAEKQLRRQLDALRGTGYSTGFVSLVEPVGAALAAMPGASISTINYNDKADEMRLNIVAADFEGVERLRSRINEAGLDAVMENSSAQGTEVRARLRVGKRS